MVIKGMLESTTLSNVNLVNADLLAKERGLRIIESTVPSTGKVCISIDTQCQGFHVRFVRHLALCLSKRECTLGSLPGS